MVAMGMQDDIVRNKSGQPLGILGVLPAFSAPRLCLLGMSNAQEQQFFAPAAATSGF